MFACVIVAKSEWACVKITYISTRRVLRGSGKLDLRRWIGIGRKFNIGDYLGILTWIQLGLCYVMHEGERGYISMRKNMNEVCSGQYQLNV